MDAHAMHTVCEPIRAHAPTTQIKMDARLPPARALWLSGWGRSRFTSFLQYVDTVPQMPLMRAPEVTLCTPILIDTAVSLTHACQLLGVGFAGDDGVFVDMVHEGAVQDVRWQWWSRRAMYVRQAAGGLDGFPLQQRVVPLTAFDGVCLLAQDRAALENGSMLLCAGSWMNGSPRYRACFVCNRGELTLAVMDLVDLPSEMLIPGRLRP